MHPVSLNSARRLKTHPRAFALTALVFLHSLPAMGAILPAVNFSWNKNPESNIARYELSYRPVSGGTWNSLSVGNNTRATVAGLIAGTEYYFIVRAVNTAGLKSAPSVLVKYKGTRENRFPVAGPMRQSTTKSTRKIMKLRGWDPDGDSLTYKIFARPKHGSLKGQGPVIIYRPRPGFIGYDRFTYRAHDGSGYSKLATVKIRIKKRGPGKVSLP